MLVTETIPLYEDKASFHTASFESRPVPLANAILLGLIVATHVCAFSLKEVAAAVPPAHPSHVRDRGAPLVCADLPVHAAVPATHSPLPRGVPASLGAADREPPAVPATEPPPPGKVGAPVVAAFFSSRAVAGAHAPLPGVVGAPLDAALLHPCPVPDAHAPPLGLAGAPFRRAYARAVPLWGRGFAVVFSFARSFHSWCEGRR